MNITNYIIWIYSIITKGLYKDNMGNSQCHKRTLPQKKSPVMAGWWHCFTHIVYPVISSNYPLVNVYRKLWTDPPFLLGKSTISMAIFNIAMLVYQRVYIYIYPVISSNIQIYPVMTLYIQMKITYPYHISINHNYISIVIDINIIYNVNIPKLIW